jgi:four helix bundle protein
LEEVPGIGERNISCFPIVSQGGGIFTNVTNEESGNSVPSNIAEGVSRNFPKETLQFLHIAKGSLYELETQVYLAFDLAYLNEKTLLSAFSQTEDCKKLLSGFINYYRNKSDP